MPIRLIQLDAVHQLLHSGDAWQIRRPRPDANGGRGAYEVLAAWQGPRRSLVHRLEDLGIVPSRAAEDELAGLPEASGFRERA